MIEIWSVLTVIAQAISFFFGIGLLVFVITTAIKKLKERKQWFVTVLVILKRGDNRLVTLTKAKRQIDQDGFEQYVFKPVRGFAVEPQKAPPLDKVYVTPSGKAFVILEMVSANEVRYLSLDELKKVNIDALSEDQKQFWIIRQKKRIELLGKRNALLKLAPYFAMIVSFLLSFMMLTQANTAIEQANRVMAQVSSNNAQTASAIVKISESMDHATTEMAKLYEAIRGVNTPPAPAGSD